MRLLIFILTLFFVTPGILSAQCDTWIGKSNEDDLKQEHVIYKGFLKDDKFEEAFPYWEKVYKVAPSADGKRNDHFYDGQQFYIKKFETAASQADKDAFAAKALEIFDHELSCTGATGEILARKAYYMFYTFNRPYGETYKALKGAIEAAGNKTQYIALVPMAYVLNDYVKNEKLPLEEARALYLNLVDIADYQISQNGKYVTQYQQSKDAMMPVLQQIEGSLFDCTWFKNKLEPEYRQNSGDADKVKEIYNKLLAQGCSEEDPLVAEIKEVLLKDYYTKNPGSLAKLMVEEGKYKEAVAKYQEAIDGTDDTERQAYYYMEMATLEFKHMERYTSARDYARKALKIRPNNGSPLLLIGDMYARSYRSCGSNDFEQRTVILAAIDKYNEAKAIDPSVAAAANERIARYAGSRPAKDDGHMMGIKEGDRHTIGCWIGETVRIQFN